MKMKKSHSPDRFAQEKIVQIENIVLEDVESLLESLGVEEYQTRYGRIDMSCPVHGGDNGTAVNLYLTGHTRAGHWVCNTHQCQKFFKPTLTGLVRGILSRNKHGWECPEDKAAGFQETVNYLLAFSNQEYDKLEIDYQSIEKRKFQSRINVAFSENRREKRGKIIPRERVREALSIPAKYYIDRGYSAEILDRYDVGLSTKKGSKAFNRVVVPIYDDEYMHMVGFSARTTNDDIKPKWVHSENFDAGKYLYNYWNAKKEIAKTGIAILVEGPGDVWKLEESGIKNSVAMFGTYLSEGQKDLLDMVGAMSLVVLTDNDKAGRIGAQSILKQCAKTYRLYFPNIKDNDVGDMTSDSITSEIQPIIQSAERSLRF
tara:strand:- start:8505 stop:9623 length:1119 start_codon:yes stop_codon:yes gene_type:complete